MMIARCVLGSVIVGSVLLFGTARASAARSACDSSAAAYNVPVPGYPFSVIESSDGRFAFVALNSGTPRQVTGIGVLRCVGGRFRFSHLVPLEAQPSGLAMTSDGKLLIAADDGFIAFIDTAAAIQRRPAIIGYFQDLTGSVEDNDPGAVYAAVSPDDRFAFISEEQNDTITVIDLSKARSNGFTRDAIVGEIPAGEAPIALSFSNDGRHLFTTSEIAPDSFGWPVACRPEGSPLATKPNHSAGAVITIDVAKAEVDPAQSVVSKVPSDCAPVRMALSPDGTVAWVTNRGSDTVTAFSTERLIGADPKARIATVAVGSNPVGIAVTRDGRYVLSGNTNRFGPGGTTAGTVSVIDSAKRAVVGTIRVGTFPRQFSVGRGDRLFLSNNRSDTITVFNAARIGTLATPP